MKPFHLRTAVFLLAALSVILQGVTSYAQKSRDGMVLVPGGTFMMGSESGYPEEKPVHEVDVQPFYMDATPVTNAQFKAFCDATHRRYPASPRWSELPDSFNACPTHPVVGISWDEAMAYAKWAGKRLPTEEEWEWAARGGIKDARYPWGDDSPSGEMLNFCDKNSEFQWRDNARNDGYRYTSPVGIYPPNAYGLYDMAGNVCEWVEDWFFPYTDKRHDTESFKDGWGGSRVCRGGCYHSPARDVTVSRRRQILAGGANTSVGFRCAADLDGVVHKEGAKVNYVHSPAGWDEKLLKMNVKLPEGQELCIGINDADPSLLKRLRCMGVTSVEQYVPWESCENAGEGQWDFSRWDAQVRNIRAAGLKWLPFIICGPAYSLPDWYRESTHFEGMTCVEHNIESKIQSFWDKNFYNYVERFLKAFAEHYKDTDIFEGLLFGISGDFGEAIVSVWHGNWPQFIPGFYHAHAGYWCQDRFARENFKSFFREKFGGDIALCNERWGTSFPSFAALDFPPIQSGPENFRIDENTAPGVFMPVDAPSRRRWIDFVDWYRASMTEYASFWMQTARKYFPDTELYLCTGGDAVPWHASEFAQQCKISAAAGGGVRITNEASVYKDNFTVTNWVASAGNFYNAYFSFEPAGQVTERGVVCRVYNAAATGARSLHYYTDNIMGNEERALNFADNVHYLREGGIVRKVAVLYPDTPMMLDTRRYGEFNESFGILRDYTDYTYVCDETIADGILDGVDALIIPMGGYYKTATLEKIRSFASAGGLLVGAGLKELRDLDRDEDWLEILFAGGRKGKTLLLDRGLVYGDALQTEVLERMTTFFRKNRLYIADGVLDGVFAADRGDGLLILNYSGDAVSRKFTTPSGRSVAVSVPDPGICEIKYSKTK